MKEELLTALRAMEGLERLESEPMSRHTSFRIGGPAAVLVCPESGEQLQTILRLCHDMEETPVILGNGSNVLAPDEGLDRVVICLKNFRQMETNGTVITVGSGVTMAKLASEALSHSLTGVEFAHGIPGTIGGGVVMNAGAYGGELKDVVTEVECYDFQGNRQIIAGAQLDFGYRHSCFDEGGYVITAVTLQLQPGDSEAIRGRMEELSAKRKNSQPLEYPSAGSTFKRPAGYFAAALIQECGLKGLTVGGAQVSEKHSGFVINRGGATCADVLALTEEIRRRVREQTGVELELEVKRLS
jgi:UDP-N-acetylmuramate dehydrogenase